MSAPNTNIEKQKRRHRGPLVGMAIGVIVVLGALIVFVSYLSDEGGVPEGAEVQIDGRTGDEVPADN